MSGANSHTNAVELKSIFNLFDQNNSGEIDIKQINQFLKSIDNLKAVSFQEKKKIRSSDSNENFPTLDNEYFKSKENFDNVNEKEGLNLNNSDIDENLLNLEKNESSVDLKVFPNKKTSINLNEFTGIFNEALSSKELQDELLLNCFSVFDYCNQGFINSKKIKDIFEVFKDKTSLEEIQNVLKFVGCIEDKMTFQEFKEFFKKNI